MFIKCPLRRLITLKIFLYSNSRCQTFLKFYMNFNIQVFWTFQIAKINLNRILYENLYSLSR
jgi:hypothetical protein